MMINDDMNIALLDVFEFKRKGGTYPAFGRNFSALSFRIDCESTFNYQYGKVLAENNSISLVPANTNYTSYTTGENLIVVHFNLCNYTIDKIQSFLPENPQEFYELFSEISRIWKDKRPGYKLKATSVFYEILSKIKKLEYKNDKKYNKYEFASEYMKRHFSDPQLSIHNVAKKIGVCDSLFRYKFKEAFGVSPKQYLDNLRIEYAIMLLQSKFFSQTEISDKCGFSDVKYFRTAFKKKTGVCISKYVLHNYIK